MMSEKDHQVTGEDAVGGVAVRRPPPLQRGHDGDGPSLRQHHGGGGDAER